MAKVEQAYTFAVGVKILTQRDHLRRDWQLLSLTLLLRRPQDDFEAVYTLLTTNSMY